VAVLYSAQENKYYIIHYWLVYSKHHWILAFLW